MLEDSLKKIQEKTKGGMQSFVLSEDEKKVMFDRVMSRETSHNLFNLFRHFYTFNTLDIYAVAFSLVLVFLGATITYSESALPGDSLYQIKTNIAEPLQGALKITSEEKLRWQEEKTIRRLEEVEALTAKGQFDDKNKNIVERKIDRNLESFSKALEQVNKEDKNKAKVSQFSLDTKARAHGEVMDKLSENAEEDTKKQVESFKSDLKDKLEKQRERLRQ